MKSNNKVATDILRSIRRITRKSTNHSRQIARQSGMTVPQILCLEAMHDADGCDGCDELTAAMVAEVTQLSAPTVTRVIDSLEGSGLVVRERSKDDRRKICLMLTDAGREHIKESMVPLPDEFFTRLRKLKSHDRTMLLEALDQIAEMMHADELNSSTTCT